MGATTAKMRLLWDILRDCGGSTSAALSRLRPIDAKPNPVPSPEILSGLTIETLDFHKRSTQSCTRSTKISRYAIYAPGAVVSQRYRPNCETSIPNIGIFPGNAQTPTRCLGDISISIEIGRIAFKNASTAGLKMLVF